VGLAALAAWLAYEAWTWPDVAGLRRRNPTTTAYIEHYRREQRAARRDDRVAWTWTPYAEISPHVKRAVLVAEDINFFSHRGFEMTEIRAALQEAIEEGELRRGASTITQQLARNLWLSPSRNPVRKLKEAILTWQLERTLDKRRILELYLNVAELGPGEAAQLAGSLPLPARWHPGSASRAYARHVARIQRRAPRAEFLWKQL
jgi:monofunctional biosynthetic peptidoglycan transglycosylase